MGERDSSRTRVQPIFQRLRDGDPTGTTWLSELCSLGSVGRAVPIAGEITGMSFEYAASPPPDFLRWLVEHPDRLHEPRYRTSPVSTTKRAALLAGEEAVRREALAAIDAGRSPNGKWWCFEGTTMVDCAIFMKDAFLFVEGKRTERGPSRDTSWFATRNQVIRNLDCARALAHRTGADYYYVLLVVEEGLSDDPRAAAAAEVTAPETVAASLPHLGEADRAALMSHYLGSTTWQSIVRAFDLDPALLAD